MWETYGLAKICIASFPGSPALDANIEVVQEFVYLRSGAGEPGNEAKICDC